MRCLAPLVAWRRWDKAGVTLKYSEGDSRFPMQLPCGGCVACLRVRARQHAIRCSHERECHEKACFITLTYNEENLPYGGSLVKEHFQRFMRDLRALVAPDRVRFFACGEYGSRFGRPHYHAILFGVDFASERYACGRRSGETVYRADSLERLWPFGRSEIGSASFASAGYVAGYVSKKLGQSALVGREPEFLVMSLKPGIGRAWIERNYESVYARDSVVIKGCEFPPPRAYDLWLADVHPDLWQFVRRRREAMRRDTLRERFPEEVAGASDSDLMKYGSVLDPDARSARWEVIEEWMVAKLNRFQREVES